MKTPEHKLHEFREKKHELFVESPGLTYSTLVDAQKIFTHLMGEWIHG